MRYDFNKISKRIREMRKSKGMSQEKLIAEMKDIYNLPIARNTLSKIENGEESAYTFDFLYTFSKMFDCDIGYLLGEYDEKKQEVHQLCLATGLSEKGINKLQEFKAENRKTAYCDIISTIIENDNCEYFLAMIGKRISLHSDKKGLQGNELVKNMIERTMYLDIDGTRSAVYKDSLIDSILQTEFVKLLPVISDEYLDKYPTTPSQRENEWDSFFRKYAQQVANGEITTEQYNEIIEAWFNKKDGEI